MERLLSPDDVGPRLDGLYGELLGDGPAPAWTPGPAEIEAFARDYRRRAYAEFRPLTQRERAEVRATRLRERALRLRAAAGPVLHQLKERLP
jgi:hypothetical protein